MKKAMIFGCAKSGTTLLQRLFYAFDGVRVIDGETSVESFAAMPEVSGVILVAKRTWNSAWSSAEGAGQVIPPDITTVVIHRDGRDVIRSSDHYVSPDRWISCMEQLRDRLPDYSVPYEWLMRAPDAVQDMFRLHPRFKWSHYPGFMPAGYDAGVYPLRPLCPKVQTEPWLPLVSDESLEIFVEHLLQRHTF